MRWSHDLEALIAATHRSVHSSCDNLGQGLMTNLLILRPVQDRSTALEPLERNQEQHVCCCGYICVRPDCSGIEWSIIVSLAETWVFLSGGTDRQDSKGCRAWCIGILLEWLQESAPAAACNCFLIGNLDSWRHLRGVNERSTTRKVSRPRWGLLGPGLHWGRWLLMDVPVTLKACIQGSGLRLWNAEWCAFRIRRLFFFCRFMWKVKAEWLAGCGSARVTKVPL